VLHYDTEKAAVLDFIAGWMDEHLA